MDSRPDNKPAIENNKDGERGVWRESCPGSGVTPRAISLGASVVHLDSLDHPSVEHGALELYLNDDERRQAARFRFDHLRRRYTCGRGLLRFLLSQLAGEPPERLEFGVGAAGKPFLAAFPGLQFNVSHSGDLFACATSRKGPIGVDVEQMRHVPKIESLAEQFFAPEETRTLLSLPPEYRERCFFECWTRKEAFLKATGEGLTRALGSFSVAFGPDTPPELLSIDGSRGAAANWRLLAFEPAPNCVGALVEQHP